VFGATTVPGARARRRAARCPPGISASHVLVLFALGRTAGRGRCEPGTSRVAPLVWSKSVSGPPAPTHTTVGCGRGRRDGPVVAVAAVARPVPGCISMAVSDDKRHCFVEHLLDRAGAPRGCKRHACEQGVAGRAGLKMRRRAQPEERVAAERDVGVDHHPVDGLEEFGDQIGFDDHPRAPRSRHAPARRADRGATGVTSARHPATISRTRCCNGGGRAQGRARHSDRCRPPSITGANTGSRTTVSAPAGGLPGWWNPLFSNSENNPSRAWRRRRATASGWFGMGGWPRSPDRTR